MRKSHLLLAGLILCLFMAGCTKDEGDREAIVEMTIYPDTGYGASVMSDVWTQPLLFSDSEDPQKRMLVDIITEGFDFDYQRGCEYILKVKKIQMQNPPQDASSVKYVFIELLSKKKAITEDSEMNMDLIVLPQTVKFSPRYPNEYEEDGETPKIYDAMLVHELGTDNWMALPRIEGFDFEEGYEYELQVAKETKAEPYSVSYVLQDIVSKKEKS